MGDFICRDNRFPFDGFVGSILLCIFQLQTFGGGIGEPKKWFIGGQWSSSEESIDNAFYSTYNVEWDFGDASPVVTGERVSHQYFADGTYTVTVYVYNASGCFTSATQEIVVGKGYTILMPNAFSPNGDNINEIIGPVFTGLKAVDFFVYNKQGIMVYEESVSETNLSADGTIEIRGWDGTNSDPASNFYVYKIIGVRINDEVVSKTGTIFLIE